MSKTFKNILLLSVVALFACKKNTEDNQNGKIIANQYAKGFLIEDFGDYKMLSFLQPYTDRKDTIRFVLTRNKEKLGAKIASSRIVQVPIKKMVSTSTTHIALLEALGSLEVLKASNSLEYVYSEKVRKLAEAGKITALSEQSVELEKILALQPDILMVSGMQASQMANYQKIIDAGIPVLINSEWMETHPLGKAEWIKVIGLLLDKEKEAQKYFEDIVAKYQNIQKLVKEKGKKVKVAVGTPQKEQWYVPAGESFGAMLLQDAGAEYAFMDTKGTGSLQMSRELVFSKFADASVWLNAELPQQAEAIFFCEYTNFLSVRDAQIYDRQKRLSPKGGNDYWESAVIHPEIVLADLVKILQPELLPEHTLTYYRKVMMACP